MTRRIRRAWCALFGHAWSRWSEWTSAGRSDLEHQRSCRRCPAVEIQRDGELGVVHA